MKIGDLLKMAIEKGASDLHIKVGVPPLARVNGDLIPLNISMKLKQEEVVGLAFSIMNEAQKAKFKKHRELDMAYSGKDLGRFRVNVFQQRGTVGMVFRVIPMKTLSIADLLLPPAIEKLAMERRGLILVTGTTGSGKSTTLASMIDHVNQNRTVNIITIEDPIEFLHRDRKGIVSQREIGYDTESFSSALRYALRQDPDVIMVGEMRDFETISTALMASETGHLVMSTLHTVDATETIGRIISVFPPYQQKQARAQLAAVLHGIVSLRLVPRSDREGRVPAAEILVVTQTVREAIIDPEKTRHIRDIISAGASQYGMQTFDQSLHDLVKKNLVSFEEAMKWAQSPDDFSLKMKGIQSTSESWEASQDKDEGDSKFEVDRF